MEKRHSAIRKTVSTSTRRLIAEDEHVLDAARKRLTKVSKSIFSKTEENVPAKLMDKGADNQRTQNEKSEKAKRIRQSALRQTVSSARPTIENHDETEVLCEKHVKFAKAMKKRQASIRKTISDTRPAIEDADMTIVAENNTKQQMHAKNSLFRQLCVLCDRSYGPLRLVSHYVKEHPNNEVMIARPSPEWAAILRSQTSPFNKIDHKVDGPCFFCEENRCTLRTNWEPHLLTHTGEQLFYCTVCKTGMKTRVEHDKQCSGRAQKIFHEHSSDGSLIGCMCNECNYLQISTDRMLKHLETEHGYLGPSEYNHYKKFTLVPKL